MIRTARTQRILDRYDLIILSTDPGALCLARDPSACLQCLGSAGQSSDPPAVKVRVANYGTVRPDLELRDWYRDCTEL